MADKKKMSAEDILAACRTGGGDSPAPKAKAAAEPEAPKAEAEKPAPAKKPGEMSAADILAAARSGGGGAAAKPADKKPGDMSAADILAAARGGGGAKPKADKPKAAKPAAAAKSPAAKSDAQAARSGPMDTSSILAAARSGDKPGPMSKAEAAAKGSPVGATKPVLPPMPEKPAYAKPAVKVGASDENRRGFMAVLFGSSLAIGFVSLSATALAWTLGTARFMFPNILIEPPSKFKVGFPSDFAAGTVATQFKAQFGVWVTNVEYEGQQQIVALKTVCTHLGCTPNWLEAEQKFKCPCHGSGFYKDGVNFEGPAPRPLERYAIRVADDGQIEVDKSKTFQEQIGQWRDPACFVPV
ncbi:MAG: ubiquinol-cytochrome c reductase iron-sulfur subunit [Planctomycetales bacterium]|nr:ubiquinol-cytochrome c reductase iron-sulfur subunit [Planctomycetales bacterium]